MISEIEMEEHRKETEEDTTDNRRSGNLDELSDDINGANEDCMENASDNN